MSNKGTCKAESCEKDVRAKGYCDRHYRKWRKGEMGKPRYRSCNEKGCNKPRARMSLCSDHFTAKHSKKPAEAAAPAPAAEAAPATESAATS
jgi:hypothetical protein